MTNGSAGSLAGAAFGLAFLGIGLGVLGGVVNTTSRQLSGRRRRSSQRPRLRRARII